MKASAGIPFGGFQFILVLIVGLFISVAAVPIALALISASERSLDLAQSALVGIVLSGVLIWHAVDATAAAAIRDYEQRIPPSWSEDWPIPGPYGIAVWGLMIVIYLAPLLSMRQEILDFLPPAGFLAFLLVALCGIFLSWDMSIKLIRRRILAKQPYAVFDAWYRTRIVSL